MQSQQFDTLLQFQDAKSKTLAEIDDIDFVNRGKYEINMRQYSPARSE